MNDALRLSDDGARFIAQWEGCVLEPYNDAAGNATIGIGHLLHLGAVNDADRRRWHGFTYRDALELLRGDVAEVEREIRAAIDVRLEQHEYDALVSLAFNCGPAVLRGNVGQLVNEHRPDAAAQAMLEWDHAGGRVLEGLRLRREAERRLFLEPDAAYMPADELRWEREYDRLRAVRKPSFMQRARIRSLRRAMTQRRKVIWKLAQQSGWSKLNRAHRYRELLTRTEG